MPPNSDPQLGTGLQCWRSHLAILPDSWLATKYSFHGSTSTGLLASAVMLMMVFH
jgi:hypothetical protein